MSLYEQPGSVHLIIPGDPNMHAEDIELGIMHPSKGFGETALIDSDLARNCDAVAINSDCILMRLELHHYDLTINAIQAEEFFNTVSACPIAECERVTSTLDKSCTLNKHASL